MLTQTFVHLRGISHATEQKLWRAGILGWEDLLTAGPRALGPHRTSEILREVEASFAALSAQDWNFFLNRLRPADQVRLFPHVRDQIAYIDIETTGLRRPAVITAIAIYDGFEYKSYVRGENLDQFPRDIAAYRMLVSYNGRRFDLPFLEREFGLRFSYPHIDLRPVMHAWGLPGGLKECERRLGIRRQVPEEMDGHLAVILWHYYTRFGDERALRLLVAYNIQDVLSLELLMIEAYHRSMKGHPYAPYLSMPQQPQLRAVPDLDELREALRAAWGM